MKKLSLLLVLVLSMGACSTVEEKAAEEFKASIKGVTYILNGAGAPNWFGNYAKSAVISTTTEYTVADDASFTISGVKFDFTEGEVVNTLAT